jgi:hypothetical protein
LADNRLHNELVGSFQASESIIENPKSIGDVINNLGVRLKDETLEQIDNSFTDTTGKLRQSIRFESKIFGESFVTELYLADYYDYINKGVKGAESSEKAPNSPYSYKDKQPPVSALKEWSHRKGLNEWAVSKSIFKKGLKGRGYFDRVVKNTKEGEINNLLIQDLISAGKLSLLKEIKNIIKE